MTIFLYSLILTGSISFLAVLLIPDGKRVMTQVVDNGTATVDNARGKTWHEVDYLRPKDDAAHPADWGYLMHRSADDAVTPTPHRTGRQPPHPARRAGRRRLPRQPDQRPGPVPGRPELAQDRPWSAWSS